MSGLREGLHRWAVVATVILTLSAAAMRRSRRARHRRQVWRRVESWPW